jgi:hypothetical protein
MHDRSDLKTCRICTMSYMVVFSVDQGTIYPRSTCSITSTSTSTVHRSYSRVSTTPSTK